MNSDDILNKLLVALSNNNIDVDWETMEIVDKNVKKAAEELFSMCGTCPYCEKKNKICSHCSEECDDSAVECWEKYISKSANY